MSNEDFYAPETVDKVFTRKGNSKTFRVRELTGEEAESLFDINGKDGKIDPVKSKGLNARIVALAVSEVADSGPVAINVDQAKRLPAKLLRDLVQSFMDLNNLSEPAAEASDQD